MPDSEDDISGITKNTWWGFRPEEWSQLECQLILGVTRWWIRPEATPWRFSWGFQGAQLCKSLRDTTRVKVWIKLNYFGKREQILALFVEIISGSFPSSFRGDLPYQAAKVLRRSLTNRPSYLPYIFHTKISYKMDFRQPGQGGGGRGPGRSRGSCAAHKEVTNNMAQHPSNKSNNNTSTNIKRFENWDSDTHKQTHKQASNTHKWCTCT